MAGPTRRGDDRRTTFLQRDDDGRVVSLPQLLVAVLIGAATGVVALVVIDGVFALIGLGEFGRASGWLAAILPALLFFDDFRAWRPHPVRFVAALVAAVVGLGLGMVVAGLAAALPPLSSGAVGAAVATLVYSVVWFVGIRLGTGHRSERT